VKLWLVAAVVSLSTIACGGVELRGARAVARGDEPGGRVLGMWVPGACRDAGGGPAERPSRVFVVQPASGPALLVEVREGHDSVVVENTFDDRGARVFQLVLRGEDERLFLHDFRLPAVGAAPGRVAVATYWHEVERPGGGFRAYLKAVDVTCELAPEAADESAGTLPPSPG
jgi:hypothetical protein